MRKMLKFGAVWFLVILMAGVLGGMERGTIGMLPGALICIIGIMSLLFAANWTGWVYSGKDKKCK